MKGKAGQGWHSCEPTAYKSEVLGITMQSQVRGSIKMDAVPSKLF